MMYKYKNTSVGVLAVCDSKKERYEVKPGEIVEIDRVLDCGAGMVLVEELEELEKPKKIKKIKNIKEEIEDGDSE